MKQKKFFLFGLMFVFILSTQATNTIVIEDQQPTQDNTLILSLDSAVQIALSENPMVQIAGKNIEIKKEANRASWEQIFSLSGTGQYSRSFKKQVIALPPEMGGPREIGTDNSLSIGVNASLALISPTLWYNSKITETDIALAVESSRASTISMVNEVKKAYYGVMLAEKSYQVLQQSADVAQQNYDNIKLMFEQGMVAEYDLIRADVSIRNLKPTLVKAKSAIDLSKLMLKVLLSLPEDMNINIVSVLDDFEKNVALESIPQYLDLSENTDLIQTQLNINKLQQQQTLSNTQRMPTLAAFGNISHQGLSNDGEAFDWATPISAGLQLNVPLWDIYSKHRQTKQVRIGIEQLEMQRDYLTKNIGVQARNCINSMLEAKEQLSSNKEGITQAQKGLDIAQTRYKIGAGTILELNDADMALMQAKLNYSQSIYNYLTAQADLEKILGAE